MWKFDSYYYDVIIYIFSGYPYFSLIYLLLFWKKIKFESNYKDVLDTSNLISVVLTIFILTQYLFEIFTAWYSGNMYEQYAFALRAFGNWVGHFIFYY
jgi:hypothetical protein